MEEIGKPETPEICTQLANRIGELVDEGNAQ